MIKIFQNISLSEVNAADQNPSLVFRRKIPEEHVTPFYCDDRLCEQHWCLERLFHSGSQ